MNDSASSQGCGIDHPTNTALEGRDAQALPLGLSQSNQPLDGVGRDSCPSRPVGSTSNLAINPQPANLILPSYQKIVPSDNSYYVQYTEKLSSIDERLLSPTTSCTPKYLVKECGCGRQVVVSGCSKNNCTICHSYIRMKRARAGMRKITSLSWQHEGHTHYPTLIYTVFTVPEALRETLIDSKNVRLLRARIWKLLKNCFGAAWAVEATHPLSERHPDKFHPHFNFIWKASKGFDSYIDVASLRRLYWLVLQGYALPYKLGISGILSHYKKALLDYYEIDVQSKYSNEGGKIWHWLYYVFRTFPEFADWTGSIRWFGKYPKLEKEQELLCPVCLRKIIAIGYLDKEGVSLYLQAQDAESRAPPDIRLVNVNLFCDY